MDALGGDGTRRLGVPLLTEIVQTSDMSIGFKDVDWALPLFQFLGRGMGRADLLGINGKVFVGQGKAINDHAKKSVRFSSSITNAIQIVSSR